MDAAEILKIRGKLGLTQSQFAAKLDVYPSHVSKWERGENKISKKNEEKILDLWSDWKLDGEGEDVISGFDPDGTVVTNAEEAKRMDRIDDLESQISDANESIWGREQYGLVPEPDDVETLNAAQEELKKAKDKLFSIRKTNTAPVIKKTFGDGVTMIQKNPPFGLKDVQKTFEKDFDTVREELKSRLDSLSSENFELDRIWDNSGLNPKTLSDKQKVEFFDNVLGEAIEKINNVLQEFLDGPHGEALKEKLRDNLDRKTKEFGDKIKATQQDIIRKSMDRETELAKEVDQLKRETRLLLQNQDTQKKLNEKMDLLLDTNAESLKEIKTKLREVNHEKEMLKEKTSQLEQELKKTDEWIEASNKFTDEEIDKLKEDIQ